MALQLASLYWNRGLGQLGNGPLIRKKTWKDEEEKMKFHILQQRNEEINAKKE